jgi:GntR family transcriptional regulator/MocR family aminotransferase
MISLELDNNSATSLYIQLYERIKEEISGGRIGTGEKLPSLRGMASNLGVSVTTVKLAYDQLIAEGYLMSRPQSAINTCLKICRSMVIPWAVKIPVILFSASTP